MKNKWHKFSHWEYWSVYFIYTPTFFLWILNMIKYKSLSFYKYSNPSIKNGGFYGDRKIDIYKLLPEDLYPKTILIEKSKNYDFQEIISVNQFRFPLIVKPDIGCRGIGVEKIVSLSDLINYNKAATQDFLIQELIDYPNELGLFYCRMPNEINGKITGLTLKKFLTVEGNGIETIKQILNKTPRYAMQIAKLNTKINLNEVLQKNEKRCLVPFGNHNRGTEFLDGSAFITDTLEKTFIKILDKVPGFYFGRLDIRYHTFVELEQGNNFSIIELNGAKSEPTHIYDPKHSFWFGQREILRHQKIMMKIVKMNVQQLTRYCQKRG